MNKTNTPDAFLLPQKVFFYNSKEAPSIVNIPSKNESNLEDSLKRQPMTPDWLLPQSNIQVKTISQLQDELNHIKIQLIDQQTKHKKDLNDFQNVLNQSLAQQKNEFKQFLSQYASENDFKIKEIQAKQEKILSEKMEDKLVELQEKLLTHFQSDSDDLELKIRRVIENLRLEEQLKTNEFLHSILLYSRLRLCCKLTILTVSSQFK